MSGAESARERPHRKANGSGDGVLSPAQIARRALRDVCDLTGRDPEGVVSVERHEDGWRVGIEVVEVHRIPDSADILAVYQTELDEHGQLQSYRRTNRYSRGVTQEE